MYKQQISLGFSPCPNDTFIFDALVNQKIDTGNLQFNPVLEDVQTLNQWALEEKLMVTKLSFGVWPQVKRNYNLLQSGAALGFGVGPLLIKSKLLQTTSINEQTIAIPGENTTANLLFSLAYPEAKNKVYLRYDEVEDFVLSGKGLGVIIHENRFTYEQKGLEKITDLGAFWEKETNSPIPLGGIVAKKTIPTVLQQQIEKLIQNSLQYAFTNYPALPQYVKQHAQEMEENVMRQHIDLYVNQYSLNLGATGNAAVKTLEMVYDQLKK
jgi:1,4-dihydroxy-6-naphthoate synthase